MKDFPYDMRLRGKYVYIFGTEEYGFHSYTYDKSTKDAFMKTRKGFICRKLKCTDRLKGYLYDDHEFTELYDNEVVLTGGEIDYVMQSWDEFLNDSNISIKHLLKLIKYLNLEDKEYDMIRHIFKSYIVLYEKGIRDSDEPYQFYEKLYNDKKIYKYTLRNVL